MFPDTPLIKNLENLDYMKVILNEKELLAERFTEIDHNRILQPKKNMKNINPPGLFDDHFLLEKLTKLGDPLERLNKFIDWDILKRLLMRCYGRIIGQV